MAYRVSSRASLYFCRYCTDRVVVLCFYPTFGKSSVNTAQLFVDLCLQRVGFTQQVLSHQSSMTWHDQTFSQLVLTQQHFSDLSSSRFCNSNGWMSRLQSIYAFVFSCAASPKLVSYLCAGRMSGPDWYLWTVCNCSMFVCHGTLHVSMMSYRDCK